MKTMWWLLVGVIAMVGTASPAPAGVAVGSSRDEVVAELGDPEMEFTRDGKRVLLYYGLELDLVDDRVVRIPPHLERELTKRRAQRRSDQEMIGKGMVKKTAGWEQAPERPKPDAAPGRPGGGAHGKGVTVISNGGKRVDLRQHLQPGKVTIVDFYADWCGPCRKISPILEGMAARDPNVELVKIDIVNWETPVARQYGLRSIPNVRVFDGQGRPVGRPTSSPSEVQKYVAKAR